MEYGKVVIVGSGKSPEPCGDGSKDSFHVPIWVRRKNAMELYGVGKDILDLWVSSGKVEAHKLNSGKNGSVVFLASDILMAIKNAPRYIPANSEEERA